MKSTIMIECDCRAGEEHDGTIESTKQGYHYEWYCSVDGKWKAFDLDTEAVVHQNPNGKWYFWDEIWADEYGPFNSKEECETTLDQYCKEFLGL